jgi:peptidyl-prolyl cis-trans isomerase D
VREDIKRRLSREKRIEKLRPAATQLLEAARSGTLESAAAAQKLTVESTVPFTRVDVVPGLGQFSQAIGAAFTIPIGQVGGPVLPRTAWRCSA